MDEMNMNNVGTENNMVDTTVETELVAEPENNASNNTGIAVAYVAGVATPFIVWGIVKGVKWIVNKVRGKKAESEATEECEEEDFSEFDEEE